jgi:hypothetical protein
MKQRETTQQFLCIWFRLLLFFLARTVRHEKEKEKPQSFSTSLNGKENVGSRTQLQWKEGLSLRTTSRSRECWFGQTSEGNQFQPNRRESKSSAFIQNRTEINKKVIRKHGKYNFPNCSISLFSTKKCGFVFQI